MIRRIAILLTLTSSVIGCATAPPPAEPVTRPAVADDQSFRQSPPEALDPRPWEFPGITRVTLDNGLRVLVAENRGAPLVTVHALVRSGADRDPGDHAGLATFTANLLDEGAGDRNAVEIAEAIGALGGRIASGAEWDSSYVDLSVLTRNLDQAIGVFADVLLRPTFPRGDFERLHQQRRTSLVQQRDNASVIATNRFAGWVYGDTPYGRSLIGSEATLDRITRSDVVRFYEQHYSPNNTSLIITGDVDPDRAVQLARQHFASWKRGTDHPPVTITPAALESNHIYIVDRPQAVQSEIRVGHAGVARSSEDYFPLLVMNTILGGNFGSRLNLNLREQHGYTYGARSGFAYRRSAGPFTVSTPVRNEVTREAVSEIMSELRRIRSGDVTQEELDAAKNYQMGIFPAMVETAAALASRLADMELYGLPEDYFTHYRDRIAAVTEEDVERVAREYVAPDRSAIVIVGKAEEIREPLTSLGLPITVHDIEGQPLEP